jgi:hypothetical protein
MDNTQQISKGHNMKCIAFVIINPVFSSTKIKGTDASLGVGYLSTLHRQPSWGKDLSISKSHIQRATQEQRKLSWNKTTTLQLQLRLWVYYSKKKIRKEKK